MSDPARHVADKLDITEQLARYARGVDTHDWDLWRSVFTDDAIIDYSSANGRPAAGRDDTADWLADSMPFLPWKQHYITNVEIDIDGDTAHVRAAFYNPMQLPGLPEPSACGGYYHHDFVRTAERLEEQAPRRGELLVRQSIPVHRNADQGTMTDIADIGPMRGPVLQSSAADRRHVQCPHRAGPPLTDRSSASRC